VAERFEPNTRRIDLLIRLRLDVRRGAEIQRVKARARSATTTTAVATAAYCDRR
jgi:hypothetical protein